MNPVRISILVAMASNRVIGDHNTLPWHLSEDLKRFKSLTMGHTIVMGRKTHDSIGRILPGRTNVVVTHQVKLEISGAIVVHTVDDALKQHDLSVQQDELFIIGGARLYEQTLGLANRIYLTEIQRDFDGDAYFPEFDRNEWIEVSREKHETTGRPDATGESSEPLEYHFVVYERKSCESN